MTLPDARTSEASSVPARAFVAKPAAMPMINSAAAKHF
jgi:hypothetical protein